MEYRWAPLEKEAHDAFNEFRRKHPDQNNPTDANTPEKFEFMKNLPVEVWMAMVRYRRDKKTWALWEPRSNHKVDASIDLKLGFADYDLFWQIYPGVKNPAEYNDRRKIEFALEIGPLRIRNMQYIRKEKNIETPQPPSQQKGLF